MTPEKFATLRKKLQQEKNHGAIMNYFFDHFADHQAFVRMSEPTRNELIETVLPIVVQALLGQRNVAVVNLLQLRVPSQQLLHGGFMAGGAMGAFFYFEDLDEGLVGLSGGRLGGQLLTARFQAKLFAPKTESP
ncbi:MAG: hypothetical protein KatS3mg020_0562 [Fimbriimonadales bacterium]|nr:MAG: hypothetical protein KatS3mg020_0562 [Fimbriimonadales bacterium]